MFGSLARIDWESEWSLARFEWAVVLGVEKDDVAAEKSYGERSDEELHDDESIAKADETRT